MSARVSPLSHPLPPGTWDSHMHVVEPDRFPLSPTAKYQPDTHTLADAHAFYSSLGIRNLVLVQPSIYATDNSCLLDALRTLTPKHGRGVVEIDPDNAVDVGLLREWHVMGVRGVRVNLVSVGKDLSGDGELRRELMRYADVIRPLKNWVLQVYIPLKMVEVLETMVDDLDVKVCVDHFGSPSLPDPFDPNDDGAEALDPYTLPGFSALVRLLEKGRTWVKLSAQYRVSRDLEGGMRDLEPLGRELVRRAPERVVYATDWPHTRFKDVDSTPFVEMCYRWCDEAGVDRVKLFRTNAEVLWDVDGQVGES